MNPDAVFKAYDIRGRTDNGDLDADLYRLAGAALVQLLEPDRVTVGRDCRHSSLEFFEAITAGITEAGADVADLGEVPTDAVYYYSGAHQMPGAVITASHNPPNYNGLKLCRSGAAPIGSGTGLEEIKAAVEAGSPPPASRTGSLATVDVIDEYVDHVLGIVGPDTLGSLRVAADAGNGMAGLTLPKVFERIPAELEGLYLEPDGNFPNHPPDPLVRENLEDLIELVSGGGFDMGVAFDGDADRAFFLDDKAQPMSGSTVTSLIARRLLARHPGASVVHNLITSRAVPEIIKENGGTPVRTKVGHSFIKQIMAETDAVFGGEHSGHYYFRDNFRADSGMLAMLILMQVMSEEARPLSELRRDVERYHSSGEVNFEVSDAAAVLGRVEETFSRAEIDHLDGLTVDFGREWFNLRPSNTEPLVRLNVEAPSQKEVEALMESVVRILEESR